MTKFLVNFNEFNDLLYSSRFLMFNLMTEFYVIFYEYYLIRLLRAVTKCSHTLAMLIQRVLWPLGCIMMVI